MNTKYDKYRVIFEDSGLTHRGEIRTVKYDPISPGYIALDNGENPENYKDSVLDFYKRIFYGEEINDIAKFEKISDKEIKELRKRFKCGMKVFHFNPSQKSA